MKRDQEDGHGPNGGIYAQMDKCGWCEKSLYADGRIVGVKAGFRLLHERCAPKYQEATEAREKALQRPSRGNVTVLPPCLDTEGWFDWTHNKPSPDSVDASLYDRAIMRENFTWY